MKNKFLLSFVVVVTLLVIYVLNHIYLGIQFDFVNFFVLFVSSSVLTVFVSVQKIKKNYLLLLFSISFLGLLIFSCFKINALQGRYDGFFLYVVGLGFCLTALFLYLADKINLPVVNGVRFISVSFVYYSFLVLFVGLSAYVFSKTGIRALHFIDGVRSNGADFVIPGISGLAAIFKWSLLMLIPFVKLKRIIIILLVISIVAVLHGKRGDVFRALLFASVYFSYLHFDRLSFKKFGFFILFSSSALVLFGYLGDLRQQSYDSAFSIVSLSQSYFESSTLAWVFTYTGFNFNVLNSYPTNGVMDKMTYVLIPFLNNSAVESYFANLSAISISGFNASTFLGPLVYDLGVFFWLELLVFLFLLIGLVFLTRVSRHRGAYFMLALLIVLLPFGNYVLTPSYFYSILFSCFIFLFVKLPVGQPRSTLK